MTPYYSDDLVTIYHGDSREWMPEADVVVTDPPYGIGFRNGRVGVASAVRIAGGVYGRDWGTMVGDDQPFDPSGFVGRPAILWGANHYASRLPDSGGWLVWDKKRGATASQGMNGSDAELAWTNIGRAVRLFSYFWDGFRRDGEVGEHYHPTQKPVALMRWCVDLTTGTVLDPFMGSGTTLVAAKSMGRHAIGIEIEERYCEIAAQRCSQETLGLSFLPPTAVSSAVQDPLPMGEDVA